MNRRQFLNVAAFTPAALPIIPLINLNVIKNTPKIFPSGFQYLDHRYLNGGFKEGSLVLVIGNIYSGKSSYIHHLKKINPKNNFHIPDMEETLSDVDYKFLRKEKHELIICEHTTKFKTPENDPLERLMLSGSDYPFQIADYVIHTQKYKLMTNTSYFIYTLIKSRYDTLPNEKPAVITSFIY